MSLDFEFLFQLGQRQHGAKHHKETMRDLPKQRRLQIDYILVANSYSPLILYASSPHMLIGNWAVKLLRGSLLQSILGKYDCRQS